MILFVVTMLAAIAALLGAVRYGARHWTRWEGKAIVAIAVLLLWIVISVGGMALMRFDIYIHDTYFSLRP